MRQRGTDANAALLMALRFPKDEDIYELFTCYKCEKRMPNGERRMDSIVLDVSAVGILGKFPEFDLPKSVVRAVPRVRTYSM